MKESPVGSIPAKLSNDQVSLLREQPHLGIARASICGASESIWGRVERAFLCNSKELTCPRQAETLPSHRVEAENSANSELKGGFPRGCIDIFVALSRTLILLHLHLNSLSRGPGVPAAEFFV